MGVFVGGMVGVAHILIGVKKLVEFGVTGIIVVARKVGVCTDVVGLSEIFGLETVVLAAQPEIRNSSAAIPIRR